MEPAGFANNVNSTVTEFFPAGVTIHLQSDCTICMTPDFGSIYDGTFCKSMVTILVTAF